MTASAFARPNRGFSDVPKKYWATTPIRSLANFNIITGGTNGKFRPGEGLSRGELAKLLASAYNIPECSVLADFKDVNSNYWASSYISASVLEGYMDGFPDGIFKPGAVTTRAQVAKILSKAKGYSVSAYSSSGKRFDDVKGSHWGYAYIQAASSNKLMSGYPDGTFRPNDKITRAEAAVIIYRSLLHKDMLMNHSAQSGIEYERYRRFTPLGPIHINVLKISKKAPVQLKVALGRNRVAGLEQLSPMARRNKALAAVNGDFFSVKTGGPSGILVNDAGLLLSSPIHKRSCLIIGADKQYSINRIEMQAKVTSANQKVGNITWVNKIRDDLKNTIVAFTPMFRPSTLTNTKGTEVVIQVGQPLRSEMHITGTVTQVRYLGGNTMIPDGSIVLSGIGSGHNYLYKNLGVGQQVSLDFSLSPKLPAGTSAIGGGPRLVRDGIARVEWEPFKREQVNGRDPRTAIGVDKSGNIIIEQVDGRMAYFSVGMTLHELAHDIASRGAIDAMQFDSGGSSTLYYAGATRNYPSSGRERMISDALIFVAEEPSVPETVPNLPAPEPIDTELAPPTPDEILQNTNANTSAP